MIYSLIFGILGFAVYGFTGLFFGILVGALFDRIRNNRIARKMHAQSQGSFFNDESQFEEQLLVLIAYVAKSDDNRLLQSEFNYCKEFLAKTFPHSDLSQTMLRFRELLNDNNTKQKCQEACNEIRQYATIHEKIAILQCLFGFATADGNAHQKELDAILRINLQIGLDRSTYESLKLLFVGFTYSYQDYGGGGYSGNYGDYGSSGNRTFESNSGPSLSDCYKILNISPDASDEEVKKAYRAAAMKYHPDRVGHLGDDVRRQAEDTFAKINEAYDKIKAARGIN